MIEIRRSPTADTRTCDATKVSKLDLALASTQHIADVAKALAFFEAKLFKASLDHDSDKLSDIDSFYADFQTNFTQTEWWDRHRKLHRHHLQNADGIPEDVNLLDVLECIADCVTSSLARSGEVYPLKLPVELLQKAFDNTVTLLKSEIRLVE